MELFYQNSDFAGKEFERDPSKYDIMYMSIILFCNGGLVTDIKSKREIMLFFMQSVLDRCIYLVL